MRKFFAYWVPMTHVQMLSSLKEKLRHQTSITKKVIISDIEDNVEISLTINTETLDVTVALLYDNQPDAFDEVQLIFQEYDDCGIFIYKVASDTVTVATETVLKIQAYHLFKDFFHKHQYHSHKQDSILLESQVSTAQQTDKDVILLHYAEIYIYKFLSYIESTTHLVPPDKIRDNFFKSSKLIKPAINQLKIVKEFIHKANGEMIYAEFLIEMIMDEEKRRIYINKLNKFKQQFELRYKQYDLVYEEIAMYYTDIINKQQYILAIVGIFIGVVSIFLSLK